MMRSLFSGEAGLKTHQTKMDVIGNNISNVNTVAFKSSSTTFSDIMYQTTSQASGATATRGGVNAKQIGLGVTNGATKVSVTSAGAAQSTGDALDIRLTDTNTTNFFVVNNGSENVFTRAGSFYIDGNGNLAMTTTGYLVMGWQVDAQNPGIINKNTVSPLRVMQADNLTSAPEATTEANFSGVIDKNDSQFNSTGGYVRSFTFYDNLGYAYTAKFSIKLLNGDTNDYSIELTNILDADNNDLLQRYTAMDANNKISDIFPADDTKNGASTSYGLDSSKFSIQSVNNNNTLVYTKDGVRYSVREAWMDNTAGGSNQLGYTFEPIDDPTANNINLSYAEIYGISSNILDTATAKNEAVNLVGLTNFADARYDITTPGSGLKFDSKLGYLVSAGAEGSTTITLKASTLGPNTEQGQAALSDIVIDFSKLLNYDNGGTSTAVANRGVPDGTVMRGEGKKLGTMTGLSVSNDGKIYGSYSNGNTVLLGQIAAAQFSNPSGLEELGNNCYKTTLNSGEFDGIGVDISADGSSMNTGQLEMANVDLSAEFTDMITTQRGFQANSRIITVSDTMLEELINLKR